MALSATSQQATLIRVAEAVFDEHLDLEVTEEAEDTGVDPGMWLSRVELSGGWTGRLDVYAGQEIMEASCGLLLCKHPANLSPSDLGDAWGEIGNLLAGLILDELPPGVRLSSPVVRRLNQPPPTEKPLSTAWVLVEGEPLGLFLYAVESADSRSQN